MAVLSEKNSFIYFQNPRTGSTMLEEVLKKELEGRFFPEPRDHKEKMVFKHITYHDLISKGFAEKKFLDSLLKFTTVRNPYIKVVSAWLGGKKFYLDHKGTQTRVENILAKECDDLEVYIKSLLLPMIYLPIRLRLAKALPSFVFVFPAVCYRLVRQLRKKRFITPEMDLILKIEEIEIDFQKVLRRLSISDDLELPVINRTESIRKPYGEYHTRWSRRFTRIMYGDIIHKFGYSFPGRIDCV